MTNEHEIRDLIHDVCDDTTISRLISEHGIDGDLVQRSELPLEAPQ